MDSTSHRNMLILFTIIYLWTSGTALHSSGSEDPQIPEVILNDRRFQDCPQVIHTTLSVQNKKLSLKLVLNPNVHLDVPLYVGENGNSTQWNAPKEPDEMCYYHDLEYNAAFSIKHTSEFSEMTGTLQTEEGTFKVTPLSYAQRRLRRALGRHKSHDHRVELISTLGLSSVHSQHRRSRRAAKETYWVQVAVVVDYAIYNRWFSASKRTTSAGKKADALQSIKYYFAHIINDVALRYKGITSTDYALNIVLSGFYIATDSDSEGWTQQVTFMENTNGGPRLVESRTLVTALGTWINKPRNGLPEFDHAMLFTGLDMYSVPKGSRVADTDTIGRAVVGDICKYDRASACEDKGLFQSSTVAAHELAHSFGALHDGENGCPASDQYIMTPEVESTRQKAEIYKNEYHFSSCSIAEMWTVIRALNRKGDNCMTDRASPDSGWDKYMEVQPGQTYDIAQQCINIYGPGSYFCGRQDHATEVCQNLLCYDPAKDGCYHTYLEAMPGTSCGDKKWCFQGECIQHEDAPHVNPTCIFGDYPGRFNVGDSTSTCEEMFTGKSHLCYNDNNRRLCCGMCHSMLTTIKDCEYGDKSSSCANKDKSICYNHANTCCETCKDAGTEIADCAFGDKASWCADLQSYNCYLNDGACCETCSKMEIDTDIADCKYGDKADFCKDLSPHECYNNDDKCCATCARLKKSSNTECMYGDRSTRCAGITRENCYANSRLCCGSCQQYETGNPKCRYGDMDSRCQPHHCTNPANHDVCCETCSQVTNK